MSPAKNEQRPVDDPDQRLDAVLEALRNQFVPPMPISSLPKVTSNRHQNWIWTATAFVVAVAAGVLLWVSSNLSFGTPDRIDSESSQAIADARHRASPVVEIAVSWTQPLDDLKADIDQLENEMHDLERFAALLDVRNEAERLVVEFAPTKYQQTSW